MARPDIRPDVGRLQIHLVYLLMELAKVLIQPLGEMGSGLVSTAGPRVMFSVQAQAPHVLAPLTPMEQSEVVAASLNLLGSHALPAQEAQRHHLMEVTVKAMAAAAAEDMVSVMAAMAQAATQD